MLKRISLYFLFMLGVWTIQAQEDRWQKNNADFSRGALRVNSSGSYLEYGDGTSFLYLGDTAWELISRLTDAETEYYMEDRREKGVTVIQTVILDELNGIDNITACGYRQLINGDINRPDSNYFARVDRVLACAASKGLYVALLPTWGDKVDKKWGMGPEIFNEENAFHYGQWLGARYVSVPNLIWIIGGDRSGEGNKSRIWNALANGIRSIDRGHLMTFHPHGEHSSSFWFHDEEWLSFNMIQTGHAQRNYAIYRKLLLPDLQKKPHKPCMDGESRYEGIPIGFKVENGRFNDYDIRTTLYQSMFSGACGYTYGCNNVWQMFDYKHTPMCNANKPWNESLNEPGAWDLIHFRRLWEKYDFREGSQQQNVICNSQMSDDNYPVAFGNHKYLLVYLPEGGKITLRISQMDKKQKTLSWMNPRTGENSFYKKVDLREFSAYAPSMGKGNDWVLIIE